MEPRDPTDEEVATCAEVMHRLVADRVGNDVTTYASLGEWERKRFERMAASVIRKWESLRNG